MRIELDPSVLYPPVEESSFEVEGVIFDVANIDDILEDLIDS